MLTPELQPIIDAGVLRHGERYRKFITGAVAWLANYLDTHNAWTLDDQPDWITYIDGLVNDKRIEVYEETDA